MTALTDGKPVLILGAGVSGCALARELLLNGVPVRLIDANDIACGATSASSRLIHGGLRYLEYGDFRLVRESLEERSRLRKLAPQFVEPLRISIPFRRRVGGMIASAVRFFGLDRSQLLQRLPIPFRNSGERGMWLVRVGLWLYDRFVDDPDFPSHAVHRVTNPRVPQVNRDLYRWVCTYTDARMLYPERFVIALLEDARQIAAERKLEFRVETYRRVKLDGAGAAVRDAGTGELTETFDPLAVVNATGAWGDRTLAEIGVSSRRLFGGTKGSHLITSQSRLRDALGGGGVYSEAGDGRLVFVLPFGESVLVGTTDERFEESPEKAVATVAELDYLLELVNDLFPNVNLQQSDIDLHYSGVRPLPYSPDGMTGAISRDHHVEVHEETALPSFTLVGGKLTTARAFAELAAGIVCKALGVPHEETSGERVIPGGEHYPHDAKALASEQSRLSNEFGLPIEQIRRIWPLFGMRTADILGDLAGSGTGHVATESLAGTQFPVGVARWVIEHEWVARLDDLVERRLMLLYESGLSRTTLKQLAQLLASAGKIESEEVDEAVTATIHRLKEQYGKRVL